MKSLNRINNFSFALISAVLIVTAGLVIGLCIPAIQSWQHKNIDDLIKQANNSQNESQKLSLLSQAALLGKNDPVATYAYAEELWKVGDYKKSIKAYQDSWLEINYNYLGMLELKSNNLSGAKAFFNKANSKDESSESFAGLSIVEFGAGNTEKGCNYANRAIKLNLSSSMAEQALALCEIYKGESKLGNRQQAYIILNSYLFNDALIRLQRIENKSSSDWLAIASIHSAQGDNSKANSALESGLKQNPADISLLKKLINNLNTLDKKEQSIKYSQQLEELEFKNFPNN